MIPVDGERYRRFNVAPTSRIPVAVKDGDVHAVEQTWGMLPPWSKQRIINARAETLHDKPFFKPMLRDHRCLIPATGFYEWREECGKKQPYHFRLKDAKPFMFAGLWRVGTGGPEFVVLTTEPNELVAPFHDRMPAMLRDEDLATWLDSPWDEALAIASPYESSLMESFLVSPKVNSPKYEGEDCIEPIEVQGSLF